MAGEPFLWNGFFFLWTIPPCRISPFVPMAISAYICGHSTCYMDRNTLLRAYKLMYSAGVMAETYESNRQITKYVHSTSRGHEAIQLATAFNLLPCDWVSPYYRDESMLLGMGWTPYELMLPGLHRGFITWKGSDRSFS
jgi:2-oxoisovalerate dehydrogenase E1 component